MHGRYFLLAWLVRCQRLKRAPRVKCPCPFHFTLQFSRVNRASLPEMVGYPTNHVVCWRGGNLTPRNPSAERYKMQGGLSPVDTGVVVDSSGPRCRGIFMLVHRGNRNLRRVQMLFALSFKEKTLNLFAFKPQNREKTLWISPIEVVPAKASAFRFYFCLAQRQIQTGQTDMSLKVQNRKRTRERSVFTLLCWQAKDSLTESFVWCNVTKTTLNIYPFLLQPQQSCRQKKPSCLQGTLIHVCATCCGRNVLYKKDYDNLRMADLATEVKSRWHALRITARLSMLLLASVVSAFKQRVVTSPFPL